MYQVRFTIAELKSNLRFITIVIFTLSINMIVFELLKFKQEHELIDAAFEFRALEKDFDSFHSLTMAQREAGSKSIPAIEQNLEIVKRRIDSTKLRKKLKPELLMKMDRLTHRASSERDLGINTEVLLLEELDNLKTDILSEEIILIHRLQRRIYLYGLVALTSPFGILAFLLYAYFYSLRSRD